MSDRDPIHLIAEYTADAPRDGWDGATLDAAKIVLLDTLAVGIGGGTGPNARALVTTTGLSGAGRDARVWGCGTWLPSASAALCNAYQAHCQEYDAVHEPAVAHVTSAIVPAIVAEAERRGGIDGSALIDAMIIGADVGAALGTAASSGLRFFRPGTAGGFGAVAALGRLVGLNHDQMVAAFSIFYGQLCGTMQAHAEGSGLLALQMAFNTRNAVTALTLAEAGFDGPQGILEGRFGYYRLFEDGGNLTTVLPNLGTRPALPDMALKPFPTGRATHGILDGCLTLQRRHGIAAHDIASIDLSVPPLIEHLVGRPVRDRMTINYARLCARYVLAAALCNVGTLGPQDFTESAYAIPDRRALADRVRLDVRREDDPNALAPIGVTVRLRDGRVLRTEVTDVYGSPANPMSADARTAKVRLCCAASAAPLPVGAADRLAEAVASIETIGDVGSLIDLIVPA